ncbi:hypothetical protein MPL1032_180036 [Mesorhizobium plurifarium]|uniref:Uncharacterized protein n=1 Tax=Mesorhizobium plurifarium TaxID=69974 RepID=A0A0K2VU61_MESPL|nr:hypothetical protein MPL1032_180036 [Mesorhizobium plurifarium]
MNDPAIGTLFAVLLRSGRAKYGWAVMLFDLLTDMGSMSSEIALIRKNALSAGPDVAPPSAIMSALSGPRQIVWPILGSPDAK